MKLRWPIGSAPVSRSASGRRFNVRRAIVPYLYLAPALIPMAVFVYLPLMRTFELSLLDWNLVQPERTFVGIDHYSSAISSPAFWNAAVNTIAYVGALLVLDVILVVATAMMVWFAPSRAQIWYRALIFLPALVSMAVASVLWLWLLNPVSGLANTVLDRVGIDGPNWFRDPSTALWAVAVVAAWKYFGYNFVIALSGLSSLPQEIIEAARIDGAGHLPLVRHIILPLLSPTIVYLVITTTALAAEIVFVPIQILTAGGPAGATDSLIFSIYQYGFQFFNVGYASAIATVVFVAFVAFTFLQLRLSERYAHYQ